MQMIRESRNPVYLALLQQNPAHSAAPSDVSHETDQSSSSSQASASVPLYNNRKGVDNLLSEANSRESKKKAR